MIRTRLSIRKLAFGILVSVLFCSCSNTFTITKKNLVPDHPRSYYNQKVFVPKPEPVQVESISLTTELSFEPAIIEDEKIDFRREKLIETAEEYLGTPYRYGGTSKRYGIDCSAFVQQAFSATEIDLPRVSRAQAAKGQSIGLAEVEVGDLLFFATSGRGRVSHVGFVHHFEDDVVHFIHASSSQGVTITPLTNSYWNARFLFAKRVLEPLEDLEDINSISLEGSNLSDSLKVGS